MSEQDRIVLIDNENMDRLARGLVDKVSIRGPDGHETIDAKLTDEGLGYINAVMPDADRNRDTVGDVLSGVTKDDLTDARATLSRFEATAVDEFDDRPQWLTTAMKAVSMAEEQYDTELDR